MNQLVEAAKGKTDLLERLFSLKGKTALITGGYRGIGRVIAETYAEAGADVVVAARNFYGCQETAMEIAARYNVKTLGLEVDVKNVKMIDAALQRILQEFGKIDILVNNAGISGSEKPVLRMTDEDMTEVMNVVFYGTFFVSRSVGLIMARRKTGKIINVTSVLSKIAARNMAGYCASKAAVIQLTRVMALELMKDNVQVNAIGPGYIVSDINRKFLESNVGKQLIEQKTPMKRAGTLEEMRSTALYLATCPPFLTGAEISIDGGHTIV